MGDGNAGKGGRTQEDSVLADTASTLVQEGKPLRTELLSQQLEALTTGGVNAQIPIIGAAQAQSREATSRALTGTQEDLARRGLSRSPFAGMAMANTRMAGERATSMIPSSIAQAFIAGAPTTAYAGVAPGMSGLGTSAGVAAQRDIAKGNQLTQMYMSIGETAASYGSSMGGGAAGCWIAARLYGMGSARFQIARWYIFNVWQGRFAPLVRWTYLRWGVRLAGSQTFCELVRPLFDTAVRRGLAELGRGI